VILPKGCLLKLVDITVTAPPPHLEGKLVFLALNKGSGADIVVGGHLY